MNLNLKCYECSHPVEAYEVCRYEDLIGWCSFACMKVTNEKNRIEVAARVTPVDPTMQSQTTMHPALWRIR